MTEQITKELITKDMTIGEVVQEYPQVANVFQEYGLHCVGCHVAFWETVEEGAQGHGMDEETIDMMVKDANTIAKESKKERKSAENENAAITITKSAIEKVKEFMKREKKEDGYLKIGVVTGGCSGMSYDLSLEKEKSDEDELIMIENLKVLVEKKYQDTLKGISIDYVDSLQGSGFKIKNPNAKNSCGCGNSFS